jgi:hypothetical protein
MSNQYVSKWCRFQKNYMNRRAGPCRHSDYSRVGWSDRKWPGRFWIRKYRHMEPPTMGTKVFQWTVKLEMESNDAVIPMPGGIVRVLRRQV